MAYDKYEDRLTTIKNHEEIEKLICETLGYDPKNTKFFREGKYDVKDCVMMHNAIDKLGRIEDKEEELGIDLETFLKVLKNRHIYVSNSYHTEFRGEHRIQDYIEIENIYYAEFSQEELEWIFTFHVYDDYASYPCLVKLKDFGKTWALTKDDLSNLSKENK